MITRRTSLALMAAATTAAGTRGLAATPGNAGIDWVTTTQTRRWQRGGPVTLTAPDTDTFGHAFDVKLTTPAQTIDGFGAAFSEVGWKALASMPAEVRGRALEALFGDDGAALTLGRTPLGANDLSLGWYSYDETAGDFPLAHFTIDRDRRTLIPFIKAAQRIRPELKIWACPWSPPTWMKTNRHYAMAPAWPGQPSNGLAPDQVRAEGTDAFIQEDRYFDAYARYFRAYVEAYRGEGIRIGMVMPQNEFNSAQPFPSCVWTPEGLARFIPHLGREMAKVDAQIFFGTLERADAGLLSRVLADPAAGRLIKGVGVQWAGKGALPLIKDRHPDLALWGSEQECGVGTNDWHYARYTWELMKTWFNNGARAYHYWNMALPAARSVSSWGWPQNALIEAGTTDFTLTNDYWVLRHLSACVKPGARFIPTPSFTGYTNQLAFRNPNGDVVIVLQNDMSQPLRIAATVGARQVAFTLPADSFNSVTIPARLVGA